MISTLILPLAAATFAASHAGGQEPVPAILPATAVATQDDAAQADDAQAEEVDLTKMPMCEGDEVVLPSGLKYCIIEKGDGSESPRFGDAVLCDYSGWLTDGTLFDSSRVAQGPGRAVEPLTFNVGGVIDGWNQALELMSPGDRWLVTIPWKLAYGENGSRSIPAKADLVFDMKLISVVDRAPKFEAWNAEAEDIITLESGVQLRVLEPGTGEAVSTGLTGVMDSSGWKKNGELLFVPDYVNGSPQVVPEFRALQKDGGRIPFTKDLTTYAKAGARLQVNVPAALGVGTLNPNAAGGAEEIWMIEFPSVKAYPKPTFRMPSAEELKTTESGLQYFVIDEGTGRRPTAANVVMAHYNGCLTTGDEFDSSFKRGTPLGFALRGVVPGWTEGLQLIREGGSIILVVPSDLGYGNRATGSIPAGSTLVFQVDLLAVQ